MRDLSAKALQKIAEQYGSEPINMLEISWSDDIPIQVYADINDNRIRGKILEISSLDNIINITDSADSQEITVVLDDTDGIIKAIMNANDIHKRDVWVKQWFKGLPFNDRFLLFRGKISSPVVWKEGDRTVSFTIISQLEDKEVGFSPEEGQFPYIPKELIGQTWPLIFGTPLDVPAVQINQAVTGTTLQGVGIISGIEYHNIKPLGGDPPDDRLAKIQIRHYRAVAKAWHIDTIGMLEEQKNSIEATERSYIKRAKDLQKQIDEAKDEFRRRQNCARAQRNQTVTRAANKGLGNNPLRILGGEDFPRGTITLEIGGGLFTGYFNDDLFHIRSRTHPGNSKQARDQARQEQTGPGSNCEPPSKPEPYYFEDGIPTVQSQINGSYVPVKKGRSAVLVTSGKIEPRIKVGGGPRLPERSLIYFWAEAGSSVTLKSDLPMYYIVSTIPGTVLQVKAYKDFNGEKRLVNVTDYNVITATYGSITTVQVVLPDALTADPEQKWAGDDIYVTFESDVGPNIIDILTYLINNYSDLAIDDTSFSATRPKLLPFPANFAILDRKNIVEVLQEIAFQARCSLRISNGVFFLSYLPEEPTAVDTLTEADIENQSVSVTLTDTEDLVTKYTAEWRLSYAQEDLDKIVLRHNVNKYGIQEETYEYYIYNQPDIIFKVATFWLIRKSNSWKKFNCNVFLNKLNLETFDAVTLNFSTNYVSNTNVKAIIEKATFDSANQTIALECWVPIKAGSMVKYPFAWPADEEEDAEFPTQEEYDAGNAGGNGIGADAVGNLPIGQVSLDGNGPIYVGGPNVIFGPQTDTGDPYPTDSGFVAQSLRIDSTIGTVSGIVKPILALDLNYISHSGLISRLGGPKTIILPLEATLVVSSESNASGKVGTLKDILQFNDDDTDSKLCIKSDARVVDITDQKKFGKLNDIFTIAEDEEDNVLAIKTTAKYTDDEDVAEFDYEFDTEGEKWGAGTAFLKEEE